MPKNHKQIKLRVVSSNPQSVIRLNAPTFVCERLGGV